MALQITQSCVNCWACVDVCPNDAIYADTPHFLIDDGKCTECLGDHADPQCAAICPIEMVGQHRGAQRVVRIAVGAAHAFVDHFLNAHRGIRPGDLHADLDEDHADPGVLTDRAMAFCRHPGVGQDLGNSVLGSGAFLAVIGFAKGLDVVERMIVADVLEGIGNGLDQVFLFDGGHAQLRASGFFDVARQGSGSWSCPQVPWPGRKRGIRRE